jgi:8-oxoguanine deaminase
MSSTLITNIDTLVTLDQHQRILHDTALYLEDHIIREVNSEQTDADQVIDASGTVVFPGFINTHLHIPQVFHRHCPAQQNQPIARWIAVTTSINREIDAEAMYYGALVCFTELMLSGVTTCLDYFYPFVKGREGTMEACLQAARDIGLRFTSIRGSMSQSKKAGTLYDEEVVEDLDAILAHSAAMIETHHQPGEYAVQRIGVGPCLPFSSTAEDYAQTASLARRYPGVILQTHAAESLWERQYCQERFNRSPIELMETTGFLGPDVSLVHCNMITEAEIRRLGETRSNVVITPICNMRDAADGNGIAPMTKLLDAGANLSIGVDGPASNDSLNVQDEMRYFRVVSRAKEGLFWYAGEDQSRFSYLPPLDVLSITNLGGARTLNRTDIGAIEPGKAADIVIFDPEHEISHAGAVNKWSALMSCAPIRPKYAFINGNMVIQDGMITMLDMRHINKEFRRLHKRIIASAEQQLGQNLTDYGTE